MGAAVDATVRREWLELAKGLAVEAGRITLKYFQRDFAIEYKSDATPVTIADRETEAFLRTSLAQRFPQHGILGEEQGETNPGAEWRWVLDPIDGTQSFIHGVPLYTTLIALQAGGKSVLGIIHCPPLEETVAAAVGCGCTFNGRPTQVTAVNKLSQARVNATDYADFMRRTPRFARALLDEAKMCRGWADGYGYLLVASGRAEVALDPVVALWDYAPLKPIIEEAGGRCTDFHGRPELPVDSFLASNGRVHDRLLELARLDFS